MLERFINPVCAYYRWTFKAGIFATSAVNFSFPQMIPIIVFLHTHMETRVTVFNSSILSHRWQTIQYHASTTWTEEQGTSVVSSQVIPISKFWSIGDACWRGLSIYYHTVKCRSRDNCMDTSSKSPGISGLPLWTGIDMQTPHRVHAANLYSLCHILLFRPHPSTAQLTNQHCIIIRPSKTWESDWKTIHLLMFTICSYKLHAIMMSACTVIMVSDQMMYRISQSHDQ